MNGAIFHSGEYGSTEQYARWVRQDEWRGFDSMDRSATAPIVALIREYQSVERPESTLASSAP